MKMRHAVLLLSLCSLLAVACGKQESSTSSQSTDPTRTQAQTDRDATTTAATPATTDTVDAAATPVTADNTGVNTRDASGNTLTPADQSNSPADISTTQQIRKAIVADKSLSINAHNIKIITKDGVVTLRGPVKDTREKTVIEQKAVEVAGQNHVQNELEITG